MKGNGIQVIDGLWWPAMDTQCRAATLSEVHNAVPWLVSHCERRGTIVQAGANVGVFPKALAKYFDRVVCAEPDFDNGRCCWLNTGGVERQVDLRKAAFGEKAGTCHIIEHEPGNCGAHRVEPDGPVTVITIDSLRLKACDAIWLDVEGSELPALKGAVETIKKFRPVIATEEKGLGSHYGYGDGSIGMWLARFGYKYVSSEGRDRLYAV